MKLVRIGLFLISTMLALCAWAYSAGLSGHTSFSLDTESAKAFLGRWDLTLKAPDREYPSWLELSEDNGQLKAQMVGRWGNARPLPKVELSNGRLTFTSPKEEEGSQTDLMFQGTLSGQILSGTLNGPDGKRWQWSGRRAPSLKRMQAPKWGKPIPLFNGKDLSGWHMDRPNATPVWKVENGALVSPGNGPELINDSKFEDFKLHVEFNCGENSNSGVYLRGRHEVQVETDSIEEPPSHHMGGIYGFIAPSPEQPRTPGKWQTYDITLVGRMVTVIQNGQTIIDNKEIPGITGGALDSHEGLPGPIYLQGSEKGHVAYRSIVITPAETIERRSFLPSGPDGFGIEIRRRLGNWHRACVNHAQGLVRATIRIGNNPRSLTKIASLRQTNVQIEGHSKRFARVNAQQLPAN